MAGFLREIDDESHLMSIPLPGLLGLVGPHRIFHDLPVLGFGNRSLRRRAGQSALSEAGGNETISARGVARNEYRNVCLLGVTGY